MKPVIVEEDFRRKVCDKVRLEPEGIGRYRVFTPFMFQDGDHLAIVLKEERGRWILSDEGHTYMHLTYELEERLFRQGTRQTIIENTLSLFSVSDSEGELRIEIDSDRYGDALYSFVQALLKVTDVKFLSRERVQSTFREDFESFMSQQIPERRRVFNWSDMERDPEGKYPVDCRVNGSKRPLFVYALQNDSQVKDATISLLQFERWGLESKSLAIYENQEEINRRAVARLSDICEKQFSSLVGARDRIKKYLAEMIGS